MSRALLGGRCCKRVDAVMKPSPHHGRLTGGAMPRLQGGGGRGAHPGGGREAGAPGPRPTPRARPALCSVCLAQAAPRCHSPRPPALCSVCRSSAAYVSHWSPLPRTVRLEHNGCPGRLRCLCFVAYLHFVPISLPSRRSSLVGQNSKLFPARNKFSGPDQRTLTLLRVSPPPRCAAGQAAGRAGAGGGGRGQTAVVPAPPG